MDIDLALSIARVKDAAAALADLEAAGCPVVDGLLSCQVTIPKMQSVGMPHNHLLDRLRQMSDSHVMFEEGALSFELTGTPGSPLDFLSDPAGDPTTIFDDTVLPVAKRAWQGDVGAAMTLPGTWHGNVTVQLRVPFQTQAPEIAWRVVRTVPVLLDAFAAYPWWRAAELIREDGRPVIAVVVNEGGTAFYTPSFVVSSLDRLHSAPIPTGMNVRRAAVQGCSAVRLPGDIVLPEELMPSQANSADPRMEQALKPKAEACAWAWLSNAVTAPNHDGVAMLEFSGYRRKVFELSADGYVADPGQQVYSAYRWATAEDSPDRVPAIRQVVSLQDGNELPGRPDDIVTAAEPLYRALRAGEVAAVLETQRQARSIAIDTARQSAEAAQTAAKSAAERTIASLGAVAGIAVANATSVLSAKDSRGIAIGIAGLFMFLALWAIFVEGPPMRSPITSLRDDLPTIASLLTPKERTAILDMSILRKAKRSVLRIRIVTPIIYVLGAALTIGIAHARFGLKFP